MPKLRWRDAALASQLRSLDAELHDAETYLQLAETQEGFLSRLTEAAATFDVRERQRVLRRGHARGADRAARTVESQLDTRSQSPKKATAARPRYRGTAL